MKPNQFKVEFSNEAEADFDKSYQYYYLENPKVAESFLRQINLGLDRIKQNPYFYQVIHKEIRKYVIRKFPFIIYYQIASSVIKVVAFFHTSRNPEIWNERL